MLGKILILPLILFLVACSPIKFEHLRGLSEREITENGGYIIYPPMQVYLLEFESAQTQGCIISNKADTKPITLPDYSNPIAVKFKSIIGQSNIGLKLINGWMVEGLNVETDTSGVITELGKLATSTLIPASATAADSTSRDGEDNCDLKNGYLCTDSR